MRIPKLIFKPGTKDILTLVSGNAFAFIIPVVLYPILSRMYSPEDYALYGLYVAVFSFLEIASAGRYDFGIVMPEHDEDAMSLVAGGLVISIGFSFVILVLVIIGGETLSNALNNPELSSWLLLLPIGLLLISASKLFTAWLIRIKRFKAASLNKATQKLAETLTQTTLGPMKMGNGLILGELTGRLFNAAFSFYQSTRSGFAIEGISKESILRNLKIYSELPKFGILPSMLNTLAGILPVFVISSYYSSETTGNFNFSRIILSVPFALISAGISQVLMQQVSERKVKAQPIYPELLSIAKKLAILSAVGVLILFFFGPHMFEMVFGEKWRESGEYTRILVFSYAVSFIVSPFSMLLVVLREIRLISLWQIFYFIAVSTLWLFRDFAIERFLLAVVVIDIISYTLYGLIMYKSILRYEQNLSNN